MKKERIKGRRRGERGEGRRKSDGRQPHCCIIDRHWSQKDKVIDPKVLMDRRNDQKVA